MFSWRMQERTDRGDLIPGEALPDALPEAPLTKMEQSLFDRPAGRLTGLFPAAGAALFSQLFCRRCNVVRFLECMAGCMQCNCHHNAGKDNPDKRNDDRE